MQALEFFQEKPEETRISILRDALENVHMPPHESPRFVRLFFTLDSGFAIAPMGIVTILTIQRKATQSVERICETMAVQSTRERHHGRIPAFRKFYLMDYRNCNPRRQRSSVLEGLYPAATYLAKNGVTR